VPSGSGSDVPSGESTSAPRRRNRGRTRRGAVATRLRGRPPILMYHGVGQVSEDPFSLFVSPQRFAQQMQTLRLLGLRGVSLAELGDSLADQQSEALVGLTFDDGYRGVLTSAAPVLARFGFTATLFAVSGLLGGENVWDELDGLGWEIGSHSVSHARLTELDPPSLHDEVINSRAALAHVMGHEPRSFCYPYGAVNEDAVAAVAAAGYEYACAVDRVAGEIMPWAMPRVGVGERDHGVRFAAKLFLRGR
jgi:peptidoglycan/xylan/chitin deacetylase (PgdA/CDA1 family)